jgi:hypothetical protein
MGVRSSAGWGRRNSRRGGGPELGHIHPKPLMARPSEMTLAAIRNSHSAGLQQFVEKSWNIEPAAVEDKGRGIPFLAGDLLGRCARKATLQNLPVG